MLETWRKRVQLFLYFPGYRIRNRKYDHIHMDNKM